ncbi:MAG: sialate O-acetylesterase [Isosphaeraceae bacterium]
MERTTPKDSRRGLARLVAALAALCLVPNTPASAQQTPAEVAKPIRLASPTAFRVYQRDRDGRASIPVRLDPEIGEGQILTARLNVSAASPAFNPAAFPGVPGFRPGLPPDEARFEGDRFVNVPTGGPYALTVTVRKGDTRADVVVDPIFVGDLWVLAGQSNMEGYGNLIDVSPSFPMVMSLGMDGAWGVAKEPLHWLVDSPDPVHSGDPATRAERSAQQHKARAKGAGLGLAFATAMVQNTGIPVGLIPCAHGGTSMAQWDPAKKAEEGKSLYGSMIRQLNLAGGGVKGVLWYQGESDANPEASQVYRKTFTEFIKAVRADLDQPDLPFYFVQIGRFIRAGDPGPWNTVQDLQRRIAEEVPGTAVVSVIDLELDDLIHVGTSGLKRTGQRLARIALRELYGQAGATTPTFDRVIKSSGNTLLVKFKGVNLVPDPSRGGVGPAPMPGMMMPDRRFGRPGMGGSPNAPVIGLTPAQRIAGFSIRKADGEEIPLIFQASLGKGLDTVELKLTGPIPEGAFLWYGHGLDPFCNLADGADMAVPVFGPVPLDDVR